MKPILYLDFDGVLHPADVRLTELEPSRPRVYQNGRPTDYPLFTHASLLEDILRPFPDVRISLSTAWVRALGYEFTVQQLPSALRERVVGTIWQGFLLKFPPLTRHDAIRTDAEERNVQRWLAVDDDVGDWPADRRHLVVAPTDTWQGLAQPGVGEEITEALDMLCRGVALESRLSRRIESPTTVGRIIGGH